MQSVELLNSTSFFPLPDQSVSGGRQRKPTELTDEVIAWQCQRHQGRENALRRRVSKCLREPIAVAIAAAFGNAPPSGGEHDFFGRNLSLLADNDKATTPIILPLNLFNPATDAPVQCPDRLQHAAMH